MPDFSVFLSFAEEDQQQAEELADHLHSFGIETPMLSGSGELHPDLQIGVRQAIEESYAFVFFVSKSYWKSSALHDELEIAESIGDKQIFALILDETANTHDFGKIYAVRHAPGVLTELSKHLYEIRSTTWLEAFQPVVEFEENLTPEQVVGTLEALSDYWRKCGGIGFSVDFQIEEAHVQEEVNV
jgi:hypothetical protein